jgi:hypothetical protein
VIALLLARVARAIRGERFVHAVELINRTINVIETLPASDEQARAIKLVELLAGRGFDAQLEAESRVFHLRLRQAATLRLVK